MCVCGTIFEGSRDDSAFYIFSSLLQVNKCTQPIVIGTRRYHNR